MWANNFGSDAFNYLKDSFNNYKEVDIGIHKVVLGLFKDYLICGGLPDAVKEYVVNKNVFNTRKVHSEIYSVYRDDCSKYQIESKLKITNIYNLLPSYMANKVKRITVKDIEQKRGRTFSTYEDEFEYLIHSGVALPARAVSNPKFPLIEAASKNLIKLYYNDVGILTNILYREKNRCNT